MLNEPEVCQIDSLGQRIRNLRKQKKLTLEALAGEQLTKGMLSLIENGKANPSMESLNYIAERLGVEVSELMEEVSTKELREVLDQAEKLYNPKEYGQSEGNYKELIELVAPYIPKLTQGYETARLLELYSSSLYHEKKDGWQTYCDKAATIYEQMSIIPRRASIGRFRAMVKFSDRDYAGSLETLLRERAKIEADHAYIDPMTQLDLDYTEAILHYAVGDSESAIRVMDNAIELSKVERIFYNIDHLYRLAAAHAMMTNDEEKANYYVKKLEQYGEFADDEMAQSFTKYLEIHHLNSYKKEYEKALERLDGSMNELDCETLLSPYLVLEKGKALYGLGMYEQALSFLDKVTIAEYIHHPLDLSIFYESDAYVARCHLALGDAEKAEHYAEKALANISAMPHTPYRDFIEETFELVKSRGHEEN